MPPANQAFITLHPVPCKVAGNAFLLPVSDFPVPEKELSCLRKFLRELIDLVLRKSGLSSKLFIQVAPLHLGGGLGRFAEHSRIWNAKMGLGVWPDREPPAIWTQEEFLNLGPDERPRRLMHQVFLINGPPDLRLQAREIMLGLGTVLEILTADGTRQLLERGKEVLLPPIKDPSFRCFPYYVPLLDRKTLQAAGDSQLLEAWLCGAFVYVRESVEDNGILIVSRETMSPILASLGGQPCPSGWNVAC